MTCRVWHAPVGRCNTVEQIAPARLGHVRRSRSTTDRGPTRITHHARGILAAGPAREPALCAAVSRPAARHVGIVSEQINLTRARLIPVTGIGSTSEAEQRATSAFLAVLSMVRELSTDLLSPMGASRAGKAIVETFTEVRLPGTKIRPDGLIRVSYGKKEPWSALVEVKTRANDLTAQAVSRVRSARPSAISLLRFLMRPRSPSRLRRRVFRLKHERQRCRYVWCFFSRGK